MDDGRVIDFKTWESKHKCNENNSNSRGGRRICSSDEKRCQDIPILQPETVTEFFGTHICGTRRGDNFLEATRADHVTGNCPEGTLPCSSATVTPENKICYPPTADQTQQVYSENKDCPITDIKILTNDELANYADNFDYTVINSIIPGGDLNIAFSKNATDNLPITTTQVTTLPCINPNQRIQKRDYYPTEIERYRKECERDEILRVVKDSRYTQSTLSLNEYDMLNNAGVLRDINSLPFRTKYLQDKDLDNRRYHFFARPTIPWKLECDDSPQTRNLIKDKLAFTASTVREDVGKTVQNIGIAIASVVGFLSIPTICCLVRSKPNDRCPMFATLGCTCVQFMVGLGLSIPVFVLASGIAEVLETTRVATTEFAEEFNGCSDRFTSVNAKIIGVDLANAIEKSGKVRLFGLITFILVILTFIIMVAAALLKVKYE